MNDAKEYLKTIIRPPAHSGWPHQEYNDWLFCKICAPLYQKYLIEKSRVKAQHPDKFILPSKYKI